MTRRGWIYTADGRCIEKGTPDHEAYLGERAYGPLVFADEGEFISPIDKKVYSGKSGMREHNKRHDVVNNRDLQGLPYRGTVKQSIDRKQLRSDLIDSAKRKGYI